MKKKTIAFTFRTDPKTFKRLSKIKWGKRSKVINAALHTYFKKAA